MTDVANAETFRRAGVIGWPIEHSRSPLIHNHWLETYGLPGRYEKQAVAPDAVAEFLSGLGAPGWVGCNVTVPHKSAAFAAATHRDASAIAVEAANTVWLEEGVLCAANSDTSGFMTHLSRSAPQWQTRDAPVVVFGAGGAARAIIFGYLEAGVAAVKVVNRTLENAEQLRKFYGDRVEPVAWANRQSAVEAAGVVVNTTTIGMAGSAIATLDIDLTRVRQPIVVADIVYVPLETPLLKAARVAGHTPVDGLGMLLHQAVFGFEKWFGHRPDVTDVLRDLVLRDLGEAS